MTDEPLVEGSEGAGFSPAPLTPSSPVWAPPRAPLPPHRLAALANALGVSTPSPATRRSSSFMSASASYPGTSSSTSDRNWRSPTPSSASTHNLSSYSPSTSKFLLHVMPPLHIPHESNSADDTSELTPPPSNASGYHTQFRRGTLVPLHPTLQSQMVAIAKEYALPSTAGMILYLSSASSAQPSPAPSVTDINEADAEEPGPRLSEDIWKHLWTRVLKAEREEALAVARSPTPNFGLGINLGLKNSPYLSQDIHGPLRPMFSPSLRGPTPQQSQSSVYPITPTPSTPSSTSDLRSHSKSAAPSFSSRSQSEDTAETSTGSHADDLETDSPVEGLHLPGLTASSIIPILAKVEFDIDKRKAGWYEPWLRSRRMNQLKRSESRKGQSGSNERTVPIQLKLSGKLGGGRFKPLSESPEHTDTELDDNFDTKTGKKIPPPLVLPPIITDDANDAAETNLAYLVNDQSHLGAYDNFEGLGEFSYDPHDPHDRRKSQYIMKTKLDEIEKTLAQFSPKDLDQTHLPTEPSNERLGSGSPIPPRSGSPLKPDESSTDQESSIWPDRSASLKAKHHTVRYENPQVSTQGKAKLSEEAVPPSPGWENPVEKPVEKTSALRKKQYRNTFKLEGSTPIPDSAEAQAAYPHIPLSSRTNTQASGSTRSVKRPPSPPRLAVNGISAPASNSFAARKNSSDFNDVLASGSTIRKGEPRGEPQDEKASHKPILAQRQASSPIIPLSPDPFGRFASNFPTSPRSFASYTNPNPPAPDAAADATSSSRFSADSLNGVDASRVGKGEKSSASLVSVKSVKKLWRKSKKLSISGQQSISAPSSNAPPLPGSSQEQLDWPPTPRSPLPPPMTSAPPVRHSRVDSAYDHFHFDQESPYPVRKSKSAKASQPSISERPITPPPTAPIPDRSSIRKSILKGWKPPSTQSQSPGGILEPQSSAEFRERPRPNPNEAVAGKNRQPSVLDINTSTEAPSPFGPDISSNPQVAMRYVQNGRVAGLNERRKSKPTITPIPPTDPSYHSPPPIPSPYLAGSSPPRSMISVASSRGSEDTRGSVDTSQFEMVSPRVNNSISYSYHGLDHDGQ